MDAVVFTTKNVLNDRVLRSNVIRIPEVSIRIKQAEKVLLSYYPGLNLFNIMSGSNDIFCNNFTLQEILILTVQIGLFDRYKRINKAPSYLVGPLTTASALQVCLNELTLEELIQQQMNDAVPKFEKNQAHGDSALPGGLSLVMFEAFIAQSTAIVGKAQSTGIRSRNLWEVIEQLIEKHALARTVVIGPGSLDYMKWFPKGSKLNGHLVIDSIEMDPMLDWFWQTEPTIAQANFN